MPDRLRFHPQLPADLQEAIRWYDEISTDLGNRFRESIDARFDDIAEHPDSFAIAFEEVRFARIQRFPYLLLFRVHGEIVHVLGVFHVASNPERWSERSDRT